MKHKILLLLAVVFGILAFVLTNQQLQAEKARTRGEVEEYAVIKVTRDIAPNEELKNGDLVRSVEKVQSAAVMTPFISWKQAEEIVGRRVNTGIAAGNLLRWDMLKERERTQGFPNEITRDMRAITIKVDAVSANAYLVRPGDYVDLIGTFRFPDMRGDASLDMTTLTLLQNVKVLSIGPRWGRVVNMSSDPNMNVSYSTVTMLLTPAEAEMIVFAQNKGTLTLSMRNFDDTFVTPDLPSVNFDYLQKNISNYNANRRSKVSFR